MFKKCYDMFAVVFAVVFALSSEEESRQLDYDNGNGEIDK